jgi:hypothetical protein
MLKTIGRFVVARINAALSARDRRIVELEKQIAALQNRLSENPLWDYVDQWVPLFIGPGGTGWRSRKLRQQRVG